MAVCLVALFFVSALPASAMEGKKDIKLKCKGAVVMDAGSGLFLYDKKGEDRFYPASCTKLMTALVALENCDDWEKKVKASKEAVDGIDPQSTQIYLKVGEKITMEQAMYALLLVSANDAAVLIAEEVGGSVSGFADMMNAKAEQLGLSDSHFVNPHGLHDKNHYTTPRDLAKITQACLAHPTFIKIFSTAKYTIPKTKKSKKRVLWNNHRMIQGKYEAYDGVIGGKSGFTSDAKCNLVTVYEKDDVRLITVTMKDGWPSECSKDTKTLLDHYLKKYEEITVTPEVGRVSVSGNRNLDVSPTQEFRLMVPKGTYAEDLNIDYETTVRDDLSYPIQPGDLVAQVRASYDGQTLDPVDLRSDEVVVKASQRAMDYLHEYWRWAVLAGVAIATTLLAILIPRRLSKRKKT